VFIEATTYEAIQGLGVMVMVFNATFNNISAISWRSVLLVEETGVPGENHQAAVSHRQTLSHNVVSSTPRLSEIRTHSIVMICTGCIGSCESNYHMITTTTAPAIQGESTEHSVSTTI
jgi:hypothetical protein